MSELAVEVEQIRKSFVVRKGWLWKREKSIFTAVDGVSFGIPRGTIMSLLGPNGAGKTTTIKMLSTLLLPDGGSARVLGHDVVRDERQVRRVLGTVLPGERTLFWKLTVRENLEYFAGLMGLRRAWARGRIETLLTGFDLRDKADTLVEKLSTGLRQRAVLCRALLADPEVLLLDEPTLGLDPVAARSLRDLIRRIRLEGKTILLTTHYMYEADELSDRVGIINGGRLVAEGTPAELKASLGLLRSVEIRLADAAPALAEELQTVGGVSHLTIADRDGQYRLTCMVSNDFHLQNLLSRAERHGVRVLGFTVKEPSLEDVFVAHSGQGGIGA